MPRHSSQRLNAIKICARFLLLFCSVCLTACAQQPRNPELDSQQRVMLAQSTSVEPEHKKAALIHVELGMHYLSQSQIARAKHKLMHAAKLAPTAVEPHSALAYFFEKVGDRVEAENEHKKALRLGGSRNGALTNNYAVFLYRQNRFKEASQVFRRALADKKYAHSAEVNENAGLCALQQADIRLAEEYFNTAINQDPKRARALLELADLKLQQKQFSVAKRLLLQHQQLEQVSARSLWLNIQMMTAEKDHKRRIAYVTELRKNFPNSKEYQQWKLSEQQGVKI